MTPSQFKQARQQLGLTQRQLANELGLSDKNGDVYIRKVENGKANPSGLLVKAMEMFCEKNGVNLKSL